MSASHPMQWIEAAPPEALAVGDDRQRLTYGELQARARGIAEGLERRHGRGRYLLLPAERSADMLCRLAACWYSGNVPVPVDPEAPDSMLAELGERCGDWALLGDIEPASVPEMRPGRGPHQGLPVLVLFTSGTSGIPKGVPVSVDNAAYSAAVISGYLGYREHPSAAVVLPLHYSYALLSQVLCMWFVGGYARIFDSFRNPIRLARAVTEESLHTFCGVPTTFQALLTLQRIAPLQLPEIEVVCSAGAAFDRSWMTAIHEVFPNATFFDNYGMTEATPRVSYIRHDDRRFSEATCGRAIDGLEIRILDEESLAPVPDGETGIIAVRGPNVFDGYLNDRDATAKAFTVDGFLLSGDLGYLDEGYLFVRGRRDEVFNVGGEKVSPLEIERVLGKHEAVECCAITGFEHPNRGTVPLAYVILRKEATRRELNEYLKQRLPAAKIPWRYYRVRSLPMTANGKLQRRRLSSDDTANVLGEVH